MRGSTNIYIYVAGQCCIAYARNSQQQRSTQIVTLLHSLNGRRPHRHTDTPTDFYMPSRYEKKREEKKINNDRPNNTPVMPLASVCVTAMQYAFCSMQQYAISVLCRRRHAARSRICSMAPYRMLGRGVSRVCRLSRPGRAFVCVCVVVWPGSV